MLTYNTFDFDFCQMVNDIINFHKSNNLGDVGFYLCDIPKDFLEGGKKLFITIDEENFYNRRILFTICDSYTLKKYKIKRYEEINYKNYQLFKSVIEYTVRIVGAGLHIININKFYGFKLTCNGLEIQFIASKNCSVGLNIYIDDNMLKYIEEKMK